MEPSYRFTPTQVAPAPAFGTSEVLETAEQRRLATESQSVYDVAVAENHIVPQVIDMRRIVSAGVDDEWLPPAGWTDRFEQLGIPTEWADDILSKVSSDAQFEQALAVYADKASRLETLAAAGDRGFWSSIGSYVSDPAAFAIDGTIGLASGAGFARRANQLRGLAAAGRAVDPGLIRQMERNRVAAGAAAAGVGNAVAGAAASTMNPEYGGADFAFDLAFGAAVGGTLEGIGVLFDRRTGQRMISDMQRAKSRPQESDPDLGDIDALFPGAGRREPDAVPNPIVEAAAELTEVTARAPERADRFALLERLDVRLSELQQGRTLELDQPARAELQAELKELRNMLRQQEKFDGVALRADPRGSARLSPDERLTATTRMAEIGRRLQQADQATVYARELAKLEKKLGNIDNDVDLINFARRLFDEPEAAPAPTQRQPDGDVAVEQGLPPAEAPMAPSAAPVGSGNFGADTASAARRPEGQVDAATNAVGAFTGRTFKAASDAIRGVVGRAKQKLGIKSLPDDELYVSERNTVGGDTRQDLESREASGPETTGRYLAARRLMFGGDISTIGRSAKDPLVQQIFKDLTADSVQTMERGADGVLRPAVNGATAEDFHKIEYMRIYIEYRRAYEAVVKRMLEGKAKGAVGKTKAMLQRVYSTDARVEIGERVGRAMRGLPDADPDIQQLVQISRKLFDNAFDLMKRNQVQGSDIQKVIDFLPRIHRRNLRDFLAQRLRNETDVPADELVADLIEKAIHGGFVRLGRTPDLFVTRTVARAYTRRLLDSADVDIGAIRTGVADMEEIEAVLQESRVPREDIDKILRHFESKSPDTSTESVASDRLKHRVPMDETVSIDLPNGGKLQLADLLENDVEVLAQRYAWESAGMAALAKSGYPNVKALTSIINDLKQQSRMTNLEYEAANQVVNHLLGRPLENDPGGVVTKAARTLGGFNFVTQMWSAWLSMPPEFAASVAFNGIKASAKQIPAFGKIIKQISSGQYPDELGRQLAAIANPGSSLIGSTVSTRADDYGMRGLEGRRFLKGLDNALASAKRATAIVGGMGTVQDMLQVYFSRGFAQQLFDMGQAGKKYSPSELERFADYGMSADDVAGLLAHMKKHGKGDSGGVVTDVGLDQMDPKLRSKVEVLFHRATRYVVIEESIGQTLPFMNKVMGSLAFQFRRHSFLSWNRRMLHGVARKDAIAANTFLYSMMVGGLAVYARAYVNSPEGSKQREVVNDPYKLMKAAFAATGEATVIPAMVDTFTTMIGNADPVFNNYHRSSGAASDFISGNASVATFDRVGRALGIPVAALSSKQRVTEEDMRALFALMPANTAVGLQRLTKSAAAQFPKERDEIRRQMIEEGEY